MRALGLAVVLTIGMTGAGIATAAKPTPQLGAFGLDLTAGDASVKPGDDFFLHADGHWIRTESLPADQSVWDSFDVLREKARLDVRAILEAAALRKSAAGSVDRKIGDYYAAFLDTATIETKGLAPAAAGLAAIAAATSYEDVARLMNRVDLGLPAPIEFAITLDSKHPDRYIVSVGHGGLGLPDRDYYLRDDAQFAALRTQYREHVARLLALAGDADAAAAAGRVLELETSIAKLHWPLAERRDRDKTYNARTIADLESQAPDFPWDAALASAELGTTRDVVVAEVTAMEPLARLFRATPITTWQSYLRYHYLLGHASRLPAAVDAEVFAFFGHTLDGQPAQRARWKRAVRATNDALGEAVGQIYVREHFPAAAKAQMLALVENLRQAFGRRIAALDWMSAPTKQAAAEKLATFRPKIGYPDRWRDYSALTVERDDAFGNATRATVFEWRRQVARLAKPADRDEWTMTPQTINAYYNPVFNEVVFPAAILQPPFFDPAADAAVNYGAIGAVIGHEMGHGFDDQGAKSDAHGVLRTWWNDADVAAFTQRVDRLADQYSSYEPLPGIKLNGRNTVGENIGDLGGLTIALDAYHATLKGRPAPRLDGLSGDQRFFLAWAQVWRGLERDEALRNDLMTDEHSPNRYRVNGVVRNVDAWYTAFGVTSADKLYLPPADRIRIW